MGYIKRTDPEDEYYFVEGCHILELSNTPDDEAVSIARARVEVGVTTRLHRLKGTVERYVIVEGRGSVTVGGSLPEEVGPGDVVIIPSMSPQKIENVGPTDLIFLAICSPRFRHEAYEDIEQ